jgi:hypothetical protein
MGCERWRPNAGHMTGHPAPKKAFMTKYCYGRDTGWSDLSAESCEYSKDGSDAVGTDPIALSLPVRALQSAESKYMVVTVSFERLV